MCSDMVRCYTGKCLVLACLRNRFAKYSNPTPTWFLLDKLTSLYEEISLYIHFFVSGMNAVSLLWELSRLNPEFTFIINNLISLLISFSFRNLVWLLMHDNASKNRF